MKVHVVRKKLPPVGRIDSFHLYMFHGRARREDVCHSYNFSHSLGDDLSRPMLISRSASRVPDVSMPSSSLVVSGRVKKALAWVPNVVLLPVRFEKLVDFPYQAGDFSFYDRSDFRSDPMRYGPDTLIERLPDVPALHERVGTYHELVVANAYRIAPNFPGLKVHWVPVDDPRDDELSDVSLAPEMFEQYPILWGSGVLAREDVFAALRPFLDEDYFYLEELAL
jgi:hypothetical protein